MTDNVVKIDRTDEVENLYVLARRAREYSDSTMALKYYEMLLLKNPTDWEAVFYFDYFNVLKENRIDYFLENGIRLALEVVKNNVKDRVEQKKAYTEIATKTIALAVVWHNEFDGGEDIVENDMAIRNDVRCAITLGDNVDELFGSDPEANEISQKVWKKAVEWHHPRFIGLNNETERFFVQEYFLKIKKYDPSYSMPFLPNNTDSSKGCGCYVATCVYGSYDCPEVWTLRRYRDNTLGSTWYGRAFIRVYYAVSPTLVKWFGDTKWFKKLWKGRLDKMVDKLKSSGVEDTTYQDKSWKK